MEYPTVQYRYLYFYHKNEKNPMIGKNIAKLWSVQLCSWVLVSSVIYILEYNVLHLCYFQIVLAGLSV